jgi:uncharacterized membrane protein
MIRFIAVLIFFGAFFWLANLGILSWHRDWPLILVFFGLLPLFFYLTRKQNRRNVIRDLERGRISATQAEELLKKSR